MLPTAFGEDDEEVDLPTGMRDLHIDPRKMLRRGSTLVVADLPTAASSSSASPASGAPDVMRTGVDPAGADAKATAKPKPPPTVFQEPDANSLLDSFGF